MKMLMMSAAAALAMIGGALAQESYSLAITDVEGLEQLQTEWGPFKAALEAATGNAFEFFPVNSRTAAVEALRAERVDFVITGPAEYVVINKMTQAEPLVALGRPDYFCAIIVMADSGITVPADLKGKKIAFDDVGSTSGHLCPMQLLADYGVDPLQDIEVIHTSRNIAHEALKRGDVAAMGANHNSWINRARSQDESVPPGAFRIIARSGDLPNDLLVVGAHVDAAAADAIRTAILENKAAVIGSIVSAGGENAKYEGMEILAVEDVQYDRVRDMYATIGQAQFAEFVGE